MCSVPMEPLPTRSSPCSQSSRSSDSRVPGSLISQAAALRFSWLAAPPATVSRCMAGFGPGRQGNSDLNALQRSPVGRCQILQHILDMICAASVYLTCRPVASALLVTCIPREIWRTVFRCSPISRVTHLASALPIAYTPLPPFSFLFLCFFFLVAALPLHFTRSPSLLILFQQAFFFLLARPSLANYSLPGHS